MASLAIRNNFGFQHYRQALLISKMNDTAYWNLKINDRYYPLAELIWNVCSYIHVGKNKLGMRQ